MYLSHMTTDMFVLSLFINEYDLSPDF